MHFWTLMMFGVWIVLETFNNHSGYNFPWNPFDILPGQTGPEYHDFHHSQVTLGNNSGNFLWWDEIFGNNKHWKKYLEEKYYTKHKKVA